MKMALTTEDRRLMCSLVSACSCVTDAATAVLAYGYGNSHAPPGFASNWQQLETQTRVLRRVMENCVKRLPEVRESHTRENAGLRMRKRD